MVGDNREEYEKSVYVPPAPMNARAGLGGTTGRKLDDQVLRDASPKMDPEQEVIRSTPNVSSILLQHSKDTLDKLLYRRDVLMNERQRIEDLIQDTSYAIDCVRGALDIKPGPQDGSMAARSTLSKY